MSSRLQKSVNKIATVTATAQSDERVIVVPLNSIRQDEQQIRKTFDKADMEQLKAEISARGQLVPMTVYPVEAKAPVRFQIRDGGRRWRALDELGIKTARVIVVDVPGSVSEKYAVQKASNVSAQTILIDDLQAFLAAVAADGKAQAEKHLLEGSYAGSRGRKFKAVASIGEEIIEHLDNAGISDLDTAYQLSRALKDEATKAKALRMVSQWAAADGISVNGSKRALLENLMDPEREARKSKAEAAVRAASRNSQAQEQEDDETESAAPSRRRSRKVVQIDLDQPTPKGCQHAERIESFADHFVLHTDKGPVKLGYAAAKLMMETFG